MVLTLLSEIRPRAETPPHLTGIVGVNEHLESEVQYLPNLDPTFPRSALHALVASCPRTLDTAYKWLAASPTYDDQRPFQI